jgi:hypothetical protein
LQRYRVGPWLSADMLSLLQVQDAVKCRVVDRQEEGNGDSGGSFQNGHAQLMVGLTAWRYKLVPPGTSRSSLCPEFCWALAALLDEF